MKKIVLLAVMISFPFFSFSQGQIIGFTVDPANPTTADFVKVYVDLQFSSGGCELDSKSHSTTGNLTTASTHHCIGMLTVICDITDTFDLGYLQAGNHQFDIVLTSGSGAPGCTPGIVPDDQDNVSFTVQSGMGMEETDQNNLVQIFPNPVSSAATVRIDPSLATGEVSMMITDASGREVMHFSNVGTDQLYISDADLSQGMYFYQLTQNDKIIYSGKFVME